MPRNKRQRISRPGLEAGSREVRSRIQTRANTPVGKKMSRLKKKKEMDKLLKTCGQHIQPAIRSFMDLRGGIVGSKWKAGNIQTPNASTRTEEGQGP